METVNMKPIIVKLLEDVSGLKRITPTYPKKWNDFPLAIYKTKRKPKFIDHDGAELETIWEITIEIYTDSGSLTGLQETIVEKFNNIGFTGNGRDANTAGLKCVECKFKAIICNETRSVYRSG